VKNLTKRNPLKAYSRYVDDTSKLLKTLRKYKEKHKEFIPKFLEKAVNDLIDSILDELDTFKHS
jgi:hypothetical protein